ncbi:hypothetical protein [Pseudomonas syringae group sp. 247E2]|uniref:hypothetical protein n=1 Tax=Pseudomonas syringae group sp. 247E2 TaxID=3079592 RepID=UPI0029158AF6|nr:hypothetical protein [Pseudomonas syringae group sp. 247E2]MDU8607616.1 hypothetical protein [Pseudomonas syringae group sp. 247E2]
MAANRLIGHFQTSVKSYKRSDLPLFQLKSKGKPNYLFYTFSKIPDIRDHLAKAYGEPFPKNINSLHSTSVVGIALSQLKELVWAISRCVQYGNELQRYVKLRQGFEKAILTNNRDESWSHLATIEKEFGFSTWLIQSKLSIAQHWDGFEGTRKIENEYTSTIENNGILSTILWFAKKRIEAATLKTNLEEELDEYISNVDEKLKLYLQCKILGQMDMLSTAMPEMLLMEGHSSIIDLYEALISGLHTAVLNDGLKGHIPKEILKPVTVLFSKTDDPNLVGILRGLGIHHKNYPSVCAKRARAVELYLQDKHKDFLDAAAEPLKENPFDVHLFTLKIKSLIALNIPHEEEKGILGNVAKHLRDVLLLNDETYISGHTILSLTGRFYCHSWINYFRSLVMHTLKEEDVEYPSYWMRDMLMRDHPLSPFVCLMSTNEAKTETLKSIPLKSHYPIALALYQILNSGTLTNVSHLPQIRIKKNLARFYLRTKQPVLAQETYRWLYENVSSANVSRFGGGMAVCHLLQKDIPKAAMAVVDSMLANPQIPSVVPIKEVADALPAADEWPNCVSYPLLLGFFLEFFDGSKISELRYAFEKFQLENDVEHPDDLLKIFDESQRGLLIAYLQKIWHPEIMRKTLIYDGTRVIEEARIKVCQKLSEIDPANEKIYTEEIKDRVKQLAIAKGMTLVQQSKVYVDVDAIRKALRSKLGNSYAMYKAASFAPQNQAEQSKGSLSEFYSESDSDSNSIARLLADIAIIRREAVSEADVQFDALYSEVTNEFLRGGHGLNAYLSTRVRHGTLSNTLRKPVEDEKLVTSKEKDREIYTPNTHWMDAFSEHSSAEHQNILRDALSNFSKEFDAILDILRDKLLQIRIVNETTTGDRSNYGLFIYNSSRLEKRLAQLEDQEIENIDKFIDKCVDRLWEKTDQNLELVQRVFSTEVKDLFHDTFDTLTQRLEPLAGNVAYGDLVNAIVRARTNTRMRLDVVTSWFKRSEVYDRQDYSVDFPFHIAVNMIKNTISIAAEWEGATITTNPDSKAMPGRTLDAMVYVFYGLIENAIKHSKLEISELRVDVDLSYLDGRYTMKFTNNISSEAIPDRELNKVAQIRESIKLKESSRRAQGEGESGLHKIWLAANGPVHKDATLEFFHTDSAFIVNLGFVIERS